MEMPLKFMLSVPKYTQWLVKMSIRISVGYRRDIARGSQGGLCDAIISERDGRSVLFFTLGLTRAIPSRYLC
ncbi:hypothetical protein DSLASN_45150 [Desulfoluna limicola]|uniref:Uncharacterized protein n=1 Tax=Desulfoluna limicola TaxID=2810562 RepID=A0ABM7PMX5_9BACT|nr:hypothetical protein DSLASN_45150 [Desulfoluna limicola]